MSSYDYTMIGDGSAPIALSALREIAVRLDRELVGWLTTVSGAGGPQSSAVWFLREGDSILLYSSSTATRLGNLAANERIAFNLRGDVRGDDIVTTEGVASIDASAPPAAENADYLAKYAVEIGRLGWTPQSFSSDFSTAIRLEIRRLRAWKPAP